jgi:anti-sigma B factor antagonist
VSSFSVSFRSADAPDSAQVCILDLNGELDAHTASELEAAFQKCIAEGKHRILVNGEHLQYISSAGLGVFMAYVEDVRDQGGDIKIAALPPRVYNVFDLLGFPVLFDITKDEQEAIDQFGRSGSTGSDAGSLRATP